MTMEATPLPTNMKPRNDNSNPQQGTGTVGRPSGAEIVHTRPSLQIPPTRKDARKLFVGGLPADSKSTLAAMLWRLLVSQY